MLNSVGLSEDPRGTPQGRLNVSEIKEGRVKQLDLSVRKYAIQARALAEISMFISLGGRLCQKLRRGPIGSRLACPQHRLKGPS